MISALSDVQNSCLSKTSYICRAIQNTSSMHSVLVNGLVQTLHDHYEKCQLHKNFEKNLRKMIKTPHSQMEKILGS